jgi:hypothetical protein
MTLADISRSRMISGYLAARIAALFSGVVVLPLTFVQPSCAESVEYQGRSFAVDSLKEIDEQNVALEIDGYPLVASKTAVGNSLFKIYSQKPELLERQGVFHGYGSWLGSLPARGDSEGAVTAVESVVASSKIGLRQKIIFYAELSANPDGERTLLRAVSSIDRGEKTACSALGFLSASSQLGLKNNPAPRLGWITTLCPQALVEMARQLMTDGDRASGISMLRAATYISREGGVGDAARISLERLDAVEKALVSQDPSQLDSALEVASFDALLSDYFDKARFDLVTEFSSRALGKGKPVVALRGLSLLDFSERNDAQHDMVSTALGQLTFQDRGIFQERGVRSLIWSYATKDELVKQQYLAILESWIQRALDENNPAQASRFLDNLKELRLDPSTDNDAVRGAIAESFVDNGDDRSADIMLSGLRTKLPWIFGFRLLLKRDIYMLIMVALGCVVILRWKFMFLGILRRMNRARKIAQEAERRAAEAAQAAERERYHSQFAEEALRADGFMDVDEYAAALKKFHLQPNVSLAQIKNAYRHVVKTLHPDINPRASEEDTDRFIDLTRTYERVLVLYAEREQRAKSWR